jgi:hypothetical protein
MPKKNEQPQPEEEQDVPRFDFSNWSAGQERAIGNIQTIASRLQLIGDRINKGTATEEERAEFMRESSVESLDAVQDAINQKLAAVCVYIPRDWFVSAAPEKIDYTNPDTYDWLRSDKRQELARALREAQKPQEAAKN